MCLAASRLSLYIKQGLHFSRLLSETWLAEVSFLFDWIIFDCAGSSLLWLFSSSCGEWGQLFVAVCGLLTVVAPVWSTGCRARRPQSCGSWALDTGLAVGAHGFSCPACGIFPDPESHLCQLRRQMNSYPLYYQGVSSRSILEIKISRGWVPQSS